MLQRKTKVVCTPAYGKKIKESNQNFENALRKHDRYLIELEKQKKLAKILQRKNPIEEKQEEREKGFSPYVNGANALVTPRLSQSRPPKIVPKGKYLFPTPTIYCKTPKHEKETNNDPTTPRRRIWCQDSIEIATDSGSKLYASWRNRNHNYSDDFEDSIDFDKNSKEANFSCNQSRPKSGPASLNQRKFWGQGSVQVKASSGGNLRASVSNITDYSMNFEKDSDDESLSEIEEEINVAIDSSHDFENDMLEFGKPLKLNVNFFKKGKET